jgi:hypothetical protein
MTQTDTTPVNTTVTLMCELVAEVLRSFGTIRFAATGWSMLPSLWPGDTLMVERPDASLPKRALTSLVRRSTFAARIAVGVHDILISRQLVAKP